MIDTAMGGMLTRFIHNGKNPTVLTVASSKRSEQSFMEQYIKTITETEGQKAIVIDKPVWEVKPKGTYGEEIFHVGLGNRYLSSIVIPDEDEDKLDSYREKGYKILDVPRFFRAKFLEDIDRNLCDIAGISSSSLNKYMSSEAVMATIDETFLNPMPDIIEVGNAPNDYAEYSNFFDMERIPKQYMSKPLYIHLDMSLSGDMTGIAGVWIIGKKTTTDGNPSKDLTFQLAFSTSVKAPKGRQISFEKNRNFIRWLKSVGFKIKAVTSDTYQAYDLQQQLKAEGFNCEILSVDRVDKDGICKPYQYLKSTIYERRFIMYKSKRLFDEFIDIERNSNTGKIDHSPCFTGDTKVRLVDGRILNFFDLVKEYKAGKINYVYSINNETLKIEPKPITNAFKTKTVTKLCKVILDNGEIITCTPEHRFMLRNGSYVEAQDLLPEDSLMPLYTKLSSKGLMGYRMYYEPIEDEWHYEHRRFAEKILDEKYLVHHQNYNKLDNTPDNLIWMSKQAHTLEHSNTHTGAYSEEANNKRKESLKNWHEENKNTPAYKERNAKCSKNNKAHWRRDNPEFLTYEERCKLKTKEHILKYFPDVIFEELSESQIRGLCTKIQHLKGEHTNYLKAHQNAKPKLQEHNELMKQLKILFPHVDEDKFFELFGFRYDSLESTQKPPWSNRYRKKLYELINHKVISVTIYDCEPTDVFDISVSDNHNFALDAGVFVHNCFHKDALDAVCAATFEASKHAEEFAYDYGESYDNMKSAIDANSDYPDAQQLTIDFEEELAKMFNPLQDEMSSLTKQQPFNSYLYLQDGIIV